MIAWGIGISDKRVRQLVLVVFALLFAVVWAPASAQTESGSLSFNHATTGFLLEGSHGRVPCESCHIQGVFRGTPRDCATCHRPGGRAPGKAANHVTTQIACEACHRTTSWTPSTFQHRPTQGVVMGACAGCHNGVGATGKSGTHIVTSLSCDACHGSATNWSYATFDHARATPPVPGRCSSCHNGTIATGKPLTHVLTSAQCDTCHTSTSTWAGASQFDHVAAIPPVAGRCTSCHNGSQAPGKPNGHIPTAAQCDTCHTNFAAFAPATMSHAGTSGPAATGNCATCHSGAYLRQNAQTKPATHIPTAAQCDTCHNSTTTWATATFNHTTATPAVAGRCATCHNGTTALGKPSTHIPTTAQCDTCHTSFSAFAPATMSHPGTAGPVAAGNCSSCHNGNFVFANALAKPATHIPTATQCDACHTNYTAFAPSTMNHAATSRPASAGNCATCHGGAYIAQNAQTKPATHISTTSQCDTCHSSTTSWATVTFDHATTSPPVAGRCSSCHGISAIGKPTTHIPTTAQCDTCHANFTAFAPATMNHNGTSGPVATGNCSSCHNGTFVFANALAQPATHIATSAQCDTCHTSTTSFANAVFDHATASPPVTGRCSTCHNGGTAPGKPGTHIPTSSQCDTCHSSFTAFAPATMNHGSSAGPAAAGNCATCHNGSFVSSRAATKPASHIPTTAQCDTCHASSSAFAPATMNHAGTTGPASAGNCSNCHSGAYLAQNAQTKPATHIPTTAQCDTCHSSTTSWATATFDHATATPAVAGRCVSCHNGANALGKPSNHIPTTAQCDTCHTNFTAFGPATMSHGGTAGPAAVGNCASCHNGSYVFANALGKPATHIPTTRQCDTCHTNYTAFLPATMNHTGLAGQCSTCHSGAYVAQNAQTKPATHVPTTAQCDTCHTSTTSWATATFNHATASPPAAGRCASCHNGTNALGKPSTHIPTTAQCDTCHTNYTAFAPATMSHSGTTGPVAAAHCASCHNGSYLFANALDKPATHIPTSSQCDTCHTSYTAFAPTTMNHTGNAGPASSGNCATCHNGSFVSSRAAAKPAGHIPTTAQCDTCHTNFSAFAPALMNHAGTSGPASAGNCSTCHSGAYVVQNAQTKPATHIATTAQCDSCHTSTTSWATATFNHTTASPPVTGRCATCHNGTNALGKPSNHIPTTAQCDTCHSNFTAFGPATMSHAGTAGPAATGNCSSCHNGSYVFANALGKPASHIPTTAQCDTCHTNYTTFLPATMSHTGTTGPASAGNCSTCHSGAYVAQNAQTKPATHIATTAQCDSCHTSTTSWATATFNHTTASPPVAGRCSSCHNGTNALGKPSTHIPTTAQCDTCHGNFTAFAPASMNHAGTAGPVATGNCSSCHNGSYLFADALAKPATHIPTTAQCDACHTNYTAFAPATMNHGGTSGPVSAGNCSTCHSGAYVAQNAQTKPATHVATSAQCDSCHTSTTSWATATFNHATATPPVAGRCSTCHNGITAITKPSTHIPTTRQCDTCHSNYTAFAPATMNHAGAAGPVATGNCATCHNGSYVAANALGKPANHIPTTAQCDTCHSGYSAFAPATMSHTGTTGPISTGNCSTCHNGAYIAQNAQTKPATHVATTAQCDSCHTSTTSWATAMFNHATASPPVAGRCSSCHNGTNALGKPSTHIPTSSQCDTCHSGYTAFAPATMNHAGTASPVATGNCSTCHNGAYVFANALGKPANHIPTTAQCDTCHTGYTAFAPATMSHTGTTGPISTGNCSTCHSGAYVAQNAQARPATHIATTAQCDSCHTSTTSWATAMFNHATASPPVTGRCSTCHNGTTALGKPSTHVPTTSQCDTCHNNFTAFAPATMNHASTAGPVATGNCTTCHNGGYIPQNALPKPAIHVPTTAQCDTCHRNYTAFAPATMNHAGTTGPVATANCSNCHNGSYTGQNALGKHALHIPTTAQCDVCHTNYTAFAPATMNHSGTTGPIATGNCAMCHSGTYTSSGAEGKPGNHIPTTTPVGMPGNECSFCHTRTTSWSARMNHGNMQTSCVICHDSSSPYDGDMEKIDRSRHHNAGAKDCSSSGCHRPLGNEGRPYSEW